MATIWQTSRLITKAFKPSPYCKGPCRSAGNRPLTVASQFGHCLISASTLGGGRLKLALIFDSLFLSRLCGGGRRAMAAPGSTPFLSRLCGGGRVMVRRRAGLVFLSRLCGGGHNGQPIERELTFLSRLCGGGPWNLGVMNPCNTKNHKTLQLITTNNSNT